MSDQLFKMEENDDVELKQKKNNNAMYNRDEKSNSQLLRQQNIIQRQSENIQVTHAFSAIYSITQVAHSMSVTKI